MALFCSCIPLLSRLEDTVQPSVSKYLCSQMVGRILANKTILVARLNSVLSWLSFFFVVEMTLFLILYCANFSVCLACLDCTSPLNFIIQGMAKIGYSCGKHSTAVIRPITLSILSSFSKMNTPLVKYMAVNYSHSNIAINFNSLLLGNQLYINT